MASYTRNEAREWAREQLKGVANVVIPSYSSDLKGLNEAGIRHDIRKEIELGFAGTLLVSEVAITLDEYRQFFAWSQDEAGGRLQLIHHAMFDTLEENIEAAKIAEAHGAELVLLCYPVSFYAESDQDIYEYTKAFCDNTNLAVMIFQVPHWGFQRVHSSDINAALLRRLIDECPNIVAIKAEGGMPSIMGVVECHRLFGKEVVISCPLEKDMIPLAQLMPLQFSGTSGTEYFGGMIPRIFGLLQAGDLDKATELYWQIHPARKAHQVASASNAQTGVINRMMWKYQAWLNGFNGGPMRQPSMRLTDAIAGQLRQGLMKSGITPTTDHDRAFFIGRNPTARAAVAGQSSRAA
jgi:4-hydroxy-tetrahydrodipicolinate synthase